MQHIDGTLLTQDDMGLEISKRYSYSFEFIQSQPNFIRTLVTMVEYRRDYFPWQSIKF